MKPCQIEGARALADNGIRHCAVYMLTINPPTYTVEFNYKVFVANRAGERRVFSKAETVIKWLRQLGIAHIDHWALL